MGRLPLPGLAACLVAGLALWFTRASFDVIGGPSGEVRVAMFPSPAELVGLTTLVIVIVFLLRHVAFRLLQGERTARAFSADSLMPFAALGALGAPYLPWLPDVLPAIRVLAGPARYVLWTVVVGHVIWLTWREAGASRGATSRDSTPTWVQAAGIFATGAAAFGVTAALRAQWPLHPLGADAAIGVLVAIVAATTAAVAWWWAVRRTGSRTSATVGCLATMGAAPWLLHSFSAFREVAAAAVLLVAIAAVPPTTLASSATLIAGGCLVATLPWLSASFAPASAVLVFLFAARQRTNQQRAFIAAPYVIGLAAWVTLWWGLSQPATSGGDAVRLDLRNLLVGLPALLFDQAYGLLPYAPGLLLAAPGLWRMLREDGETRRVGTAIGLVALALVATVSASNVWLDGGPVPARHIVPVLPLLVLPIARWDAAMTRLPVLQAGGRVLVFLTLAISLVLVTARGGLLTSNRRDGSSQLLEWLAPSHGVVRVAPSFAASGDVLLTPLLLSAVWLAAAIALAWLLARVRPVSPGLAAAVALGVVIGGTVLTATALPLALGHRLQPRLTPQARPESAMLTAFDSRARPIAVVYDAWHRIPPEHVPALFRFEGRPGMRRDPQPLRVLLNTRLALPAGRYDVEVTPASGAELEGDIALQLGRTGRPLCEWPAKSEPGKIWSHEFRLDVDTTFVGFRSSPQLEQRVGQVVVRPRAIVNAAERLDRRLALPPVLAAARYADTVVYFHDSDTFPEPAGFWVRGASDAVATFARAPEAEPRPIRIRVHSGAAPNHVQFSTGAWRTSLDLVPFQGAVIDIPILRSANQAAVRIHTARGFVPAQTTGGRDRRFLGCWVEVIE
jgi:hypothetical protein